MGAGPRHARVGANGSVGAAAPSGAAWPSAACADPDLAIGPARWTDLPAIARLQARAFRPGLAYRLPTLASLKLIPGACFLVARRHGSVAGCAIGDRDGGNARLVNLAVDPDHRRRGVGLALLAALEAGLPAGDVVLMVEAGNLGAQALYRRAGYADDGSAANYYGPGRHGLWMRKPRPGGVPRVRV